MVLSIVLYKRVFRRLILVAWKGAGHHLGLQNLTLDQTTGAYCARREVRTVLTFSRTATLYTLLFARHVVARACAGVDGVTPDGY